MIGIGLKTQHVAPLLAQPRVLDFVEVHAENYMVCGGPVLAQLERVRERFPLSIHGVGLSIGGEGALDRAHLERLAALLSRFQPHWFSEHLAWSRHGPACFNDLLPLPYDMQTLRRVCEHVDQVQARLGRRMLIENPATYLQCEASTLDEGAFLGEVVRRTGCGLLLDVSNAYVSAVNHGRDARCDIEALPLQAVGEIHLAGFHEDRDAAGEPLLVDAHGSPVDDAVWALYGAVVRRVGPAPTLIERDHDVPSLQALCAEARRAERLMREAAARAREAAA